MLLVPFVIFEPAFSPIAMLSLPVAEPKANAPTAVFRAPVTLLGIAFRPTMVLLKPCVADCRAKAPTAVLPKPVVLLFNAESPTAAFSNPVAAPNASAATPTFALAAPASGRNIREPLYSNPGISTSPFGLTVARAAPPVAIPKEPTPGEKIPVVALVVKLSDGAAADPGVSVLG